MEIEAAQSVLATDRALRKEKLFAFLMGEMVRRDHRQCVAVSLFYAPGADFHDEEIRTWSREEEPKRFELSFIEELSFEILHLAQAECDSKKPGKHRFYVRTTQHLGTRPRHSFSLYSTANDDVSDHRSFHEGDDLHDPRKTILIRVAGDIASGLVQRYSREIDPEAVATVSVNIAEAILKKAGV